MRFSVVSVLTLSISLGFSQAFFPSPGPQVSRQVGNMLQYWQQPMGSQRFSGVSRSSLRMSDEESSPGNAVVTGQDDVEGVAAEVEPLAPGGFVGPAMQPAEDKKKEVEMKKSSEPEENKWASGAFKRGVALQAVVLSFVIFLQLQPPEVRNLAICPPFSHGGCVDFADWVQIVFAGAPIPPM